MKKVTVIILALCLTALPLAEASNPWTDESSSSSRWIYDFSENHHELKSMIEEEGVDVSLARNRGGYVFLFKIEYMGMDDGLHRFYYAGGYYSRGDIHLSLEFEYKDMPSTGEIPMNIDQVESDFQGYLWVKEHQYQVGATNISAYGITKQRIITNGVIGVNVNMDVTTRDKSVAMKLSYNLDNRWDLDLDIDYDPPLPWIPSTPGEASDFERDINASYSGTLVGGVELVLDYNLPYPNVDEDISMKIEGDELIPAKLSFRGNLIYEKLSPILGCVNLGYESIMKHTGVEGYQEGFLINSIGIPSQGGLENSFYTSYRRPSLDSFFFDPCLKAANRYLESDILVIDSEMIGSQEVTGEELEAFREDKREYFNDHIQLSEPHPWLIFVIIPIIIFFVILVLGYLLFFRKKQRPTKYYPDETYDSSEYSSSHEQR
ncbi:MAG: hypothetical protein R6U17_05400 [Thermoplasmata archaeon]